MEQSLPDRLDHVLAQHQVVEVPPRNQDSLPPRQPPRRARVEKAFDLVIHPADRLDLPLLVDRAGHGEVLAEGEAREGGQQRVDLRAGGGVPIDAVVRLLEAEAGGKSQRLVAREAVAKEAGKDQHPLVVCRAGEARLALDVDDSLPPHADRGGDASGPAEVMVPDLVDGEAVHLPGAAPLRVHKEQPAVEQLLHLVLERTRSRTARSTCSSRTRPLPSRRAQ